MCRCIIVLLTLGLIVKCDDSFSKSEEREGRLLTENTNVDRWKAIQPNEEGKAVWQEPNVPLSVDESQEIIPTKRRRLRKRKRRPLVFNEDDGLYHPRPRRRRPIRLDEINDTWDEMEAESPKRPNKRRRITPVYQPIDNSGSVSATISFGADQDVLSKSGVETVPKVEDLSNRKVQENKERILPSTTTRSTTVQNIKKLIKQNEGLSLSEVLQQRNLSLTDLLKGKKQAISALTNKTDNKSESIIINKNQTEIEEPKKTFENETINKNYNDINKLVIESTTEKKIFVPSHPKYYTSMDYNPNLESITEKTNKVEKPKKNNIVEPNQNLPITSAKLHVSIKKKQLPEQPPKPFKISLNEIFGYENVLRDKRKNSGEGPLKMSFNLEDLFKQSETTTSEVPSTTIKPVIVVHTTQSKLKSLSPKEDLNELLTNEKEKENLSKILENRNMTVDELVQLRERGSSQRHLAEIFHNNTKEPEPVLEHVVRINVNEQRKGKNIINAIINNATEESSFPPSNLVVKNISNDVLPESDTKVLHQSTSSEVYLKPLPDVSISSEEITVPARIPSTSFPTYKIETNKNINESPINTPFWKTVYPGSYNENRILTKEIEEIEQNLAEAVNEEQDSLINESNNYYSDDNFNLPIGVKSAIYASFAIMGMSLLVFVTIMIIFRWSQRHKRRLSYTENFTCSKIKSPILTGNHTPRTFKTFVSETLGRKKTIYTSSHLQSMSDTWDKRF